MTSVLIAEIIIQWAFHCLTRLAVVSRLMGSTFCFCLLIFFTIAVRPIISESTRLCQIFGVGKTIAVDNSLRLVFRSHTGYFHGNQILLVFTARCYASAVLAIALFLSVCLSVRHKSVFY